MLSTFRISYFKQRKWRKLLSCTVQLGWVHSWNIFFHQQAANLYDKMRLVKQSAQLEHWQSTLQRDCNRPTQQLYNWRRSGRKQIAVQAYMQGLYANINWSKKMALILSSHIFMFLSRLQFLKQEYNEFSIQSYSNQAQGAKDVLKNSIQHSILYSDRCWIISVGLLHVFEQKTFSFCASIA